MRRMYSEQELTNVIKAVFEQELEDGALDENVADAVDAYLVENPVDITALEGQDVEVKSLTATDAINGVEKLADANGNKRFLEWDLTTATITGLTSRYAKASLSGTHLQIVYAFEYEAGTINNSTQLANVTIPKWIGNKIFPISTGIVAFDYSDAWSSDFNYSVELKARLVKNTGSTYDVLVIYITGGNFVAEQNIIGRISFDLLIDLE